MVSDKLLAPGNRGRSQPGPGLASRGIFRFEGYTSFCKACYPHCYIAGFNTSGTMKKVFIFFKHSTAPLQEEWIEGTFASLYHLSLNSLMGLMWEYDGCSHQTMPDDWWLSMTSNNAWRICISLHFMESSTSRTDNALKKQEEIKAQISALQAQLLALPDDGAIIVKDPNSPPKRKKPTTLAPATPSPSKSFHKCHHISLSLTYRKETANRGERWQSDGCSTHLPTEISPIIEHWGCAVHKICGS